MIAVEMSMSDPVTSFEDSMEVVGAEEPTRDRKIKNLRRRDWDAREPEMGEEKAGMAIHRPNLFDRVVQALHTLVVERDTKHSPSIKSHDRVLVDAGQR
jgi:hypothetical protein